MRYYSDTFSATNPDQVSAINTYSLIPDVFFLIRDGLEEASRVLVACNHVRAIKLFIDSINTQCPYIGKTIIPKYV